MDSLPQLLTKRELAEACRLTPRTIEKLIASGKAPPVTRLGGRIFFQQDLVAAWLNQQTGLLPPT